MKYLSFTILTILFFCSCVTRNKNFDKQDGQMVSRMKSEYVQTTDSISIEMTDSVYGLSKKYMITERVLVNNSRVPYLTWYDNASDIPIRNVEEEMKYYFWKPFGDFALGHLLMDVDIIISEFEPQIGTTFFKRINPGSSFKYFFVIKKDGEIKNPADAVFCVPQTTVEGCLGGSIPDEREALMYHEPYVIIPVGCSALTSRETNMIEKRVKGLAYAGEKNRKN